MSQASRLRASNPAESMNGDVVPSGTGVNRAALTLVVVILLIIFASRVTRLNTLDMQQDEVWSVWQTLGTPQQVINWTPYDWSPTFYLIVDGWQNLTGIGPFTIRLLPIFVFLIGVALVYRITDKWYGARAAIMAILVFSALGYILFLSTLLRGYIFNLTLWLLALWLALRYFERPSWQRAVALCWPIILMFYIHVSSVFGVAMIVVITLILYRRAIWRWWLPGIVTFVVCLPDAISQVSVAAHYTTAVPAFYYTLPVLQGRLTDHYLDYAGQEIGIWLVLLLVASALMLERWVLRRRSVVLILWMLSPFVLVVVATAFGAFNPRHVAWVMVGFAIWMGAGLSLLNRAARAAFTVILVIMMFGYVPLHERYEIALGRSPLVAAFSELKHQVRTGDVVFIDPKCDGCMGAAPEEWDYFSRATFPNGLKFVTDPASYPRVWYVAAKGHEDPTLFKRLQQTRAQSATIGGDTLLFRLYEAPPSADGVVFENGLRLNGVETLNNGLSPLVWHEGDTVHVRLWWSVNQALTADYSEGTYFLKPDGSIGSENNAPPQILNGPQQTSQWLVGRYYLEEREIQLPYPLSTGTQSLLLAIYQSWDGKRLTAPGMSADNLLTIKQIAVKAW